MKTSKSIKVWLMVALTTAFACGNSGANSKSEQKDENKQQSQAIEIANPVPDEYNFDFEEFALDKLPGSWSQYYQGKGGTDWRVVDDKGNKVMAQLYSDNPNSHFNVVVNNDIVAKDMTLIVRLKGVTGKHDQGGGFVWRFIDKSNYYVVRANPLEDNVVLYKVKDGKRTDLPLVGEGRTYGVDVPPLGGGWNTLKLKVDGELFTVYLNDKELFQVKDNTFTGEGKFGFWSKADAVTYFDDFTIEKY